MFASIEGLTYNYVLLLHERCSNYSCIDFFGSCISLQKLQKLRGNFVNKAMSYDIDSCHYSFDLLHLQVLELNRVDFKDVKQWSLVARLAAGAPNLQQLEILTKKLSRNKKGERILKNNREGTILKNYREGRIFKNNREGMILKKQERILKKQERILKNKRERRILKKQERRKDSIEQDDEDDEDATNDQDDEGDEDYSGEEGGDDEDGGDLEEKDVEANGEGGSDNDDDDDDDDEDGDGDDKE